MNPPEPISGKSVIVLTGAAGRLGQPLHRALTDAGKNVRGVDLVKGPGRFPLIEADLHKAEECRRVLEGAAVLVHLAYNRCEKFPSEITFEDHLRLNRQVLRMACEAGVQKIIFTSSVQVIARQGPEFRAHFMPPYLPLDEHSPPDPDNGYGRAKLRTEEMLAELSRVYGIDCIGLRLPSLVRKSPGAGEQICSDRYSEAFSYLTTCDAANLIVRLIDTDLSGFRIYFPASRKNGLGRPAAEVIREKFQGVVLRKEAQEIESLVDISTIRSETGWEPLELDEEFSFDSWFQRLGNWFFSRQLKNSQET